MLSQSSLCIIRPSLPRWVWYIKKITLLPGFRSGLWGLPHSVTASYPGASGRARTSNENFCQERPLLSVSYNWVSSAGAMLAITNELDRVRIPVPPHRLYFKIGPPRGRRDPGKLSPFMCRYSLPALSWRHDLTGLSSGLRPLYSSIAWLAICKDTRTGVATRCIAKVYAECA